MSGTPGAQDPNQFDEADFQAVLRALLAAYLPELEADLRRAQAPADLTEEARGKPPSCEDEIALAEAIFGNFLTEEVALRMLPPAGREQLGPPAQWRWCLVHLRCCLIFGWLVCRGPRTFRAFSYYVYRYWLCVRAAIGTPVHTPPTEEEQADFRALVDVLAVAFKPYLTDQLASVAYPTGIPEEVLDGRIDCLEGLEDTDAVFERLLSPAAAEALLGRAAFAEHRGQPAFWYCRCWCLCLIRFGCCLARARNLVDLFHCLEFLFRCLNDCFQPIRCDITAPSGCAEEMPGLSGLPAGEVGLEIIGTATGAFFGHYTLEWRLAMGQACTDPATDIFWNDGATGLVFYPGGGTSGTVPVVAGVLGWLDTTFLPTGSYEIRLRVFTTTGALACTFCTPPFVLFKKLVLISRVAENPGAFVATPPGPFDGSAPIVSANPAPPGVVVPVGGPISVWGAAFVGDCQNRRIKCIDLRAAIGFQPGPLDPGFAASLPLYTHPMLSPGPICYDDVPPADEIKKRLIRLDSPLSELTVYWQHLTTIPGQPWFLKPNPFESESLLPHFVIDPITGCPDQHHRCQSGQYTILLDVTDTTLPFPNHYYDTQQVWFDNKPITVLFAGLEGLPSCQDLHLGLGAPFIPPGAPCNTPWLVNLLGIAYDELIDRTGPITYPNLNFDFYALYITKQTGEVLQVPITVSPDPVNPLHGISRRGQPGVPCDPFPAGGPGCPPAEVWPGQSFDVLTALDMRVFDAVCAPSIPPAEHYTLPPPIVPPGFPLERGTCCGYTFQLYAQDKTWSDGWAGGFHNAWSLPWAVCICNDLPSTGGG